MHRIPTHRSHRRGNYSMTMGLFMPVLIGFGALSVDISYINMARTQSQNVADAASHAAYVGYRATSSIAVGNAAADLILNNNSVGNQTAALEALEYGIWDFSTGDFTVSTTQVNAARAVVARDEANGNALDLFFAPLLGRDKAGVSGTSVTAGRTRQVMLISDVSGSFAGDIGEAANASVAFLDHMEANPINGDKLGHVVFAGTSNFPDLHELASPTLDHESLETAFSQLDVCVNMTGAMRGSPPETACHTSQARGMHRALMEFIQNGNENEFQAMVLLTDGNANTFLTEDVNNGAGQSQAEDDTEMLRDILWYGGTFSYNVWECDLGATSSADPSCGERTYAGEFGGGVHLWTVYFGAEGSNTAWLESLVDVPGNLGEAKNTSTAAELTTIYQEIAASMPVVLTE